MQSATQSAGLPASSRRADDLIHMIGETSAIVSPPDVCMKLEMLALSDTADVQAFSDVIALDPNLTAQVLRLANSAALSFRGRIDTVSRAVMVLGSEETLALAYAAYAVAGFSKLRSPATDMGIFWQHAAHVGLIAKELAREQGVLHPERLFVAGLLHDLGSLLINFHHPDRAREIQAASGACEMRLAKLELEEFGFSHAELGAALLESWHLPETLCAAVRDHHEASQASYHLETAILYVADILSAQFGANFCVAPNDEAVIPDSVLNCLQMPPDFDRCHYFDAVAPEFVQMIHSLIG